MTNRRRPEKHTMIRKLAKPRNVGEAVQLARLCRGVSQARLASVCGLHQSAICRVEQGLQHMTLEEIRNGALLLKVDPRWIAFPDLEPNPFGKEIEEAKGKAGEQY